MARMTRLEFEGAVYHVMSRGTEKKDIFVSPGDSKRFIELLEQMSERFAVDIYAYVLMGNHYHLLMETVRPNLSKAMHYLNSVYSQHFNHCHKRVGHFFQGRYFAILIEKDSYLLEVSRYIHLNPVRAGIVRRPEQYVWSSYREYIGKEKKRWVKTGAVMDQFSGRKERAHRFYREFVEDALESRENPLRDAVAGLVLGSEKFVRKIREALADSEDDGSRRTIPEQALAFEDVLGLVSRKMNVPKKRILQTGKRDNLPRKICMCLLRELTDLSNAEIAARFSTTEAAASKMALRTREEMNQNPKLKKQILEIRDGVRPGH
jgi:REP element-mobilizing transposase RayT